MIFKKEEESLTTCIHDKAYAKRKCSTENSNLERTAVYAGKAIPYQPSQRAEVQRATQSSLLHR